MFHWLLTAVLLSAVVPALAADDPAHTRNPLAVLSASIRQVTREVTPAVVEVLVNGYSGGDEGDGKTSGIITLQRSSGSGVIVDPAGYVVTNAHVVEGAITVKVVIAAASVAADYEPESKTLVANIIGIDRDSDLALLRIDGGPLPSVAFGDSDSLAQGDVVLAIGSPVLLRNSVTMGVVSAPARLVHEEDPIRYIQTDAPINPGDSGGALVDTDGHLMGVTTFIVSRTGGNEGIGFAIPARVVQDVYRQLRANGKVARGYLGIFTQTITPALAAALDLPVGKGALISDVEPEGPGDTAGLRRRDVVVELNDVAIGSARQLNNAANQTKAGARVVLGILRGSNKLSLVVEAAERPIALPSLAPLVSPATSLVNRGFSVLSSAEIRRI